MSTTVFSFALESCVRKNGGEKWLVKKGYHPSGREIGTLRCIILHESENLLLSNLDR